MSVLEKAIKHFNGKVQSSDLIPVEIPEWEMTVYYRMTNSASRIDKILRAGSDGAVMSRLAEILIQLALDEDGKRAFKTTDRRTLLTEVDKDVLIRVADQVSLGMVESEADELDVAGKNLKKTQAS